MSHRRLLAIALIAGTPAIAAAQFTTFIPPVNRAVDSIKTVVAVQQRAHTDSIVNTQLTNIKTWVDSAAGTMAQMPSPTTDTTAAATTVATTATTTSPASRRSDSTTMRNGMPAPATASALPLLILAGLAGLGLGGFLVFGAREPDRARERA